MPIIYFHTSLLIHYKSGSVPLSLAVPVCISFRSLNSSRPSNFWLFWWHELCSVDLDLDPVWIHRDLSVLLDSTSVSDESFSNSILFISSDHFCAVVAKIRNNHFSGICFDAEWNLPFLKSLWFFFLIHSRNRISFDGSCYNPTIHCHSHLPPLCWTCQTFWQLDFSSQLYHWCFCLNWEEMQKCYRSL